MMASARKFFVCSILVGSLLANPFEPSSSRGELRRCSVKGHFNSAGPGWTKIAPPRFPPEDDPIRLDGSVAEGAGDFIRGFAVDPKDPNVIYAANWARLMRSTDGGCTWKEVLDRSGSRPVNLDSPFSSEGIRAVVAGPGRVIVLAPGSAALGEKPTTQLMISTDRGDGWEQVEWPGPLYVASLAVAPSKPNVVYATESRFGIGPPVTWGGSEEATTVWRSSDFGMSWQQRGPEGGNPSRLLTVDPHNPNELWTWSGGYEEYELVSHSTDGGQLWRSLEDPIRDCLLVESGGLRGFEVSHPRGKRSFLIASAQAPHFSDWQHRVCRSKDGGYTWTLAKWPSAATPLQFAFGRSVGDLMGVVPGTGSVGRYRAKHDDWVIASPGGVGKISDETNGPPGVSASIARGRSVFFILADEVEGKHPRPQALWRYER